VDWDYALPVTMDLQSVVTALSRNLSFLLCHQLICGLGLCAKAHEPEKGYASKQSKSKLSQIMGLLAFTREPVGSSFKTIKKQGCSKVATSLFCCVIN
jgi:hypothetical protein